MSSYVLHPGGVCLDVRHNVGVTGDAVACSRVADRAWEMLVEGVGFGRDSFFDKSEGYSFTTVRVLVVIVVIRGRDLF